VKATVPLLIAALAFSTAYFAWKAGQKTDPNAYVEKAKYDEAVKAAEIQHKIDLATIAAGNVVIAAQDKQIKDILATAGQPSPAEQQKDKQISALAAKVATLEAQGDLAGALAAAKLEIKAWAEKFDLAAGRHQDSLSALNKAWQVKFDAQVSISSAWEAAYNREHGLRLSSEALVKKLMPKKWKKWATYGGYALAFVVGNISHR